MRTIQVNDLIDRSKFNSFFLGTFLICLFTRTLDGYEINMFSVIIPGMLKEGKLSPLQMGFLASCSMYGMIFGSIGFGMLADKIGRKHSIAMCIFLFSFFSGMCAFTDSFPVFVTYRFLSGVGMAGLLPVLTSQLSEYSPLKIRATLVSSGILGQAFGAQLSAGVAMLLLSYLGLHWKSMFYVGFSPLLLIPFIYLYMSDSITYYIKKGDKASIAKTLAKADPEYVPAADDEYQVRTFPGKKASFGSLFRHGMASTTLILWALIFIDLFIIFGLSTWLPKMLMGQGYSFKSSLVLTWVWFLGPLVGVPTLGYVADRFGYKPALIGCYIFGAIVFTIISTSPGFYFLMGMAFLGGAVVHGTQGVASSYVCSCYPVAIRSTAMGWASGLGRLGASIGAGLGGVLIAYHFTFQQIILVWGVAALCGAGLTYLSRDYSKIPFDTLESAKGAVIDDPADAY